jgi:putative SOS response-associated peptidase YedK
MCANYRPVTRLDRLLTHFGVEREPDEQTPEEVFALGLAPFIRLHRPGSGHKLIASGQFGLLPHFAKELAYGRRTYNARSETVATLPSFRDAWARGQRCIIPAEAVFEPNYETGRAVRWCVQQPGGVPLAIAGVYARTPLVRRPDGSPGYSFAMLTVNAAEHPLYARLHKPGDEKRMPVFLHPHEHDAWLGCSVADAPRWLRVWDGVLEGLPAPLPAQVRRPAPTAVSDPQTGELF